MFKEDVLVWDMSACMEIGQHSVGGVILMFGLTVCIVGTWLDNFPHFGIIVNSYLEANW